MKKSLFYAFLLAGALCCWSCGGSDDVTDNGDEPGGGTVTPIIPDANAVEISNNGFEEAKEVNGQWEIAGWTINRNYGPKEANAKASVSIVDGAGRQNSRALKIQQLPTNGKCCVVLERELTGLEPDVMYRMSASLRYSDIPNNEGYGPVLFSPNTNQYWNSSKYHYGTNLENWTTTYVDFMADDDGKAKICIGLGFWQGGAANGGYSTGTVYWDHVTVTKMTSQMFMRESEHMRIWIETGKVTTSGTIIDDWLKRVDAMYEAYEDLVGARPVQGRKLGILSTRGMYSGYWALAGYPILWGANSSAIESTFAEIAEHGSVSFGLMHEVGHVFNVDWNDGNYYSNWNWNDEMFANFRMHYGLEMTGGKVYMKGNGEDKQRVYTGGEILDMYKQDYDITLPTGKFNDNAIHYLLANLTKTIGWEPFKRTFRELNTTNCPYGNKFDKFKNFVNTLSRHTSDIYGTEYDIYNNMFNEAERKAVEAQLK